MSNKEFNQLLMNANLNSKTAVEKLNISKTTIKRYVCGKSEPKKPTINYLKTLSGDLSVIDKKYSGWYLKRGEYPHLGKSVFKDFTIKFHT